MKIFFAGSQGQGKSTQAQLIGETLRLPVIDGLSRNSPFKMGTMDHQEYLRSAVIDQSRHPQGAVFCRSIIDVHAYTDAYFGTRVPQADQDEESFARTNPIVIYFPRVLDIEDDGVRPTDVELAKKVDEYIQRRLKELKIKHLVLSAGTPMDRNLEIFNYLKGRDADAVIRLFH